MYTQDTFVISNTVWVKYCRIPARWGLQQTTLAPGSDETRARDPLVSQYLDKVNLVINYQTLKNMDRLLDPFY